MLSSTNALDVRPLTRLFRALGDETRLRIVALLSHGELCVCHLESALDLNQSTASRHLGILRAAEIVDCRRESSATMRSRVSSPSARNNRVSGRT
ncbi:MAG TPA: metalloregulator ArsR/SmtB family transcription factor, partial [Kofleriaceae bacterium]